jgi:hypothetical protein
MKTSNFLYLIYIIIAITSVNCRQPNTVKQLKKDEVIKIDVKWIDFDLETDVRIDCDQFERSFDGGSFTTAISSRKNIDSIIQIIRNMKRIDNTYEPDVRGKMWLYHSNKVVDTICFSNIVLSYKNMSYNTPPQLIRLLDDKSKQQKPQ